MYFKTLLTLALLICSSQLFSNQVKTVCAATINSDDEIKALAKYTDKSKFRIVELTDFQRETDNDTEKWFKRACQSGVKCDVLLVSGHFGGIFFGKERDEKLSLETMEDFSCNQSCPGILNNPKEVYLFGCNTLASKQGDHRTREEYLQVLIDDGLSPSFAEQVAEARYGAMGTTFKDRTQRVFTGVPHIYGFDSTSPLGKYLGPSFARYLKRLGGLSDHLDTIEKPFSVAPDENSLLPKYMSKNFRQASGMIKFDQKSKNICTIYGRGGAEELDRIKLITEIISRPMFNQTRKGEFYTYLPGIIHYLANLNPKKQKYIKETYPNEMSIMKASWEAREAVRQIFPSLKYTPGMQLDVLDLNYFLGWMNLDYYKSERNKLFLQLLRKGDEASANSICGYPNWNRSIEIDIKANDIPYIHFQDNHIYKMAGCLKLQDPEFINRGANKLVKDTQNFTHMTEKELELLFSLSITKSNPKLLASLILESAYLVKGKKGFMSRWYLTLGNVARYSPRVMDIVIDEFQRPTMDFIHLLEMALGNSEFTEIQVKKIKVIIENSNNEKIKSILKKYLPKPKVKKKKWWQK